MNEEHEIDGVDEKELEPNEAAQEQEAASNEADTEQDPVTALENQVAALKDELLRRSAELDNYRKRMAKEMGESRKFANTGLLAELLPVLDNFGMGMQMAEKEQGSMLYQGMAMVQGQLADFFEGQGVKPLVLEPGADFDPNFHEAVSQEESDEIEDGKILRTVRAGYQLGDRLLRPANVIVAKSAEPETETPEGNE